MRKGRHDVDVRLLGRRIETAAHLFAVDGDGRISSTRSHHVSMKFVKERLKAAWLHLSKQP